MYYGLNRMNRPRVVASVCDILPRRNCTLMHKLGTTIKSGIFVFKYTYTETTGRAAFYLLCVWYVSEPLCRVFIAPLRHRTNMFHDKFSSFDALYERKNESNHRKTCIRVDVTARSSCVVFSMPSIMTNASISVHRQPK